MALKDVIIGYAKGDKGDKGDTGERGATGQTGPQGEPGNIADAAITDTQGLDVAKGAKTTAQKLFDAIADRIVNKLVTNDTLTTKLADYLLKSAMSSTNINSTTNVPTSALVYSLLQDVNNNLSKFSAKSIGENYVMNYTDFSDSDTSLYGIVSLANSPSGNAPDNNVGDFRILRLGTNNGKYNTLILSSPRFDGLYIGKFWDGNWQGWKQLASTDDLNERFSSSASGTIYNSVSDFPATGSGFGVNTQALTLYAGFVIPEYSRICFMNYGYSQDGALIAIASSGEIYSAFRNKGTWQNGKAR